METELIIQNYNFSNFEIVKQNWSRARTWTVSSLYNDMREKNNRIYIFEDNRLEGENLAMLKWKELSNLEKVMKNLSKELSENKKKVERFEALLEVINDLVKKSNLDQNKEILKKILKLS